VYVQWENKAILVRRSGVNPRSPKAMGYPQRGLEISPGPGPPTHSFYFVTIKT
jgi:hypothetical protein